AFDRQQDLVVADEGAHAVDVVAPPYTSITGTLGSGWSQPWDVTINNAGTRAYVTDTSAQTVQVLTYPAGSNIVTLPASFPEAAVGSRNYVP
ncbi:MAG TPA: hypothetical protein VHS56_14440, partial [Candidatus Cybelea sp.]|nr:hypothetical protein [Candidatus Cybelea sp.]